MNTVLPRAPWVFTAFFPAVVPGWSLVETFKNISIPALLTKVWKPQLCVSIIYKTFCYVFFLFNLGERKREERNKFSRWRNKSSSLELERDTVNIRKAPRYWKGAEAAQHISHTDSAEQTGAKTIKKKEKKNQTCSKFQRSTILFWLALSPAC